MSRAAWELLFMMVILKIPIAYLCCVVWYAIKAEPTPPGTEPPDRSTWRPWRRPDGPRPRRGGPHGRSRARVARAGRNRVRT
ncbi:MAG TPA: hypothetical protein VFA05_02080 [Gaiellaceae bacterium]|nr:hypothetical protein [Gaiellaceae bacterium]